MRPRPKRRTCEDCVASERSEASHRSGPPSREALRRGLAVALAEAEARRRSAERATVLGSPRGEAPRIRRASAAKRATRTERADEAARERACRGVRGAKPLG